MRVLIVRFFILLGLFFPALASASYTDNHDGTVTDSATGFTWMRCAMGQTWSGSTCTGTASTYTWDRAVALTSTFAGRSDWRLPNAWELQSIVNYDGSSPAIDGAMFPNTPASFFWSGSSYVPNPTYAWYVSFDDGYTDANSKTNGYYVRLVRGGQSFGALTTPTADFTDNGDGTVTHGRTGLTWMRCALGQTWSGSTCTGTASTYTWDQAVALTSTFAGHSDWRLPDALELGYIVEYGASSPSINGAIFPNTPASFFWSGSSYVPYPSDAWTVYFSSGGTYAFNKTNYVYVRLVRGGQSLGSLAGGALTSQTPISNTRVFAYAEANYSSIFAGLPTTGQYQQYDYRYYPASGNYLAVDTSHAIYLLGPFTNNVITSVGPVESFRSYITAWESTIVNGNCGASSGGTFTAAPTANLCSAGTASSVSGSGPWSWSCQGGIGGTNMSCSANKQAPAVSSCSQSAINTALIAYGNCVMAGYSSAECRTGCVP